MQQSIHNITLLVRDYNEAIDFFTGKLHFELLEDTDLQNGKRWVRVRPKASDGVCLLLAKAANSDQAAFIGKQGGGRVFLFLYTDDLQRDYQNMLANGIEFERLPKKEPYGTVAVFKDLYGNLWDIIEPVQLP